MSPSAIRRIPLEAVLWVAGLVYLAFAEAAAAKTHFTLCPLANAGLDFCPGCGLGRSITLLFHGDIPASFGAHPLGAFAVAVLLFRIFSLTKFSLQHYGKNH